MVVRYLLKCRKVRKTVAVPVGATKGGRRPRLVERIVHFGGSGSGRRWPVRLGMGRPGFRWRRAFGGRGAFRRGRLLLGRKSGGGGGGVSGTRRGNRRCVVAVLYSTVRQRKKRYGTPSVPVLILRKVRKWKKNKSKLFNDTSSEKNKNKNKNKNKYKNKNKNNKKQNKIIK